MKTPLVKTNTIFAALLAIGMVSLAGLGARAQQAKPAAGQEVPNNLAPHPAPAQPLPFSHKLHITQGLQCKDCHANPDPGNQMTVPVASACMSCHMAVATDKPAIKKLAGFAKSNQPIPWARVYQLTPGVTWTHRAHLKAGLQCAMCHGEVAQLDAMAQTTSVTAMGVCIGCHQAKGAATVCSTCHSWPGNVPSAAKTTSGEARVTGGAGQAPTPGKDAFQWVENRGSGPMAILFAQAARPRTAR